MPRLTDNKFDFKTNTIVKFAIAFFTCIIITLLFPQSETIETDYSVGMVWSKEDLIAPFSFPIYKSKEVYTKEVDEARRKAFPIFEINPIKSNNSSNWLDSLNKQFSQIGKVVVYEIEFIKESSLPEEKRTTNEQLLQKMKNEVILSLNSEEWKGLASCYSSNNPVSQEAFRKKIIQSLNQVYEKKLINVSKSQFSSKQISIIRNKIEESIEISSVAGTDEIDRILRNEYSMYFKNSILADVAFKISKIFIYPDYIFNQSETDKVINAVVESIPRTFGIVRENERIVSKHNPINELTRLKLESYKKIRSEQLGSSDYWIQQSGRFLLVAFLIILIGIFLFKLRYRLFADNYSLILISSIILFECIISYLSFHIRSDYPIEYMIFISVAAMLFTIIYDSRFAFYAIIIICFLISLIRGGDYDILIPNFAASILVIYSVRDIKKRSQIFLSMVFILIGYIVTILAMGLEHYNNTVTLRQQIIFAGLNSLLSPILAYGLLIFYEKVFRLATDLVFLELTDFNHPLLRELSTKAPGTFHHSIVMGNLSEKAAEEIGANQILARVGCYYHDIGKIITPGYFVENQMDSNKHEQLNPSLSAKMIISHVKNGIRLAEKFRLPHEVIDFIPMHHGTNLVSYFYEKARSEDGAVEQVHDYIYRYPGPKPQTKETGIVMLADSVEAATRSIDDPTPAKMETQIDEIIKARFMDGELDDCDLTLKDLTNIKQSFMKTLVGIYHHRIKYPEESNETENKKA